MTKSNQPDGFLTMQPCDWYEDRVTFPCVIQPKIDGVAGYNRNGKLLGRSLKPHSNLHVTKMFSKPEYHGFCGELVLGNNPSANDLCNLTSSALRTVNGEPDITWYVFDYITEETKSLPYIHRIDRLRDYLADNKITPKIVQMSYLYAESMEELLSIENQYLDEGFEGAVIRDPYLPYKYGRCGKTFMGAWRIKRFIEEEIIVTSIEEGETNLNEATINERGRSERSTLQQNMQPNGLVGNIKGNLVKDVLCPQTRKVLIKKDTEVVVSPGKMSAILRKYYFENQAELIGKQVKFKMFPKGIKDKPRFPTFVCIRNSNDLSE